MGRAGAAELVDDHVLAVAVAVAEAGGVAAAHVVEGQAAAELAVRIGAHVAHVLVHRESSFNFCLLSPLVSEGMNTLPQSPIIVKPTGVENLKSLIFY